MLKTLLNSNLPRKRRIPMKKNQNSAWVLSRRIWKMRHLSGEKMTKTRHNHLARQKKIVMQFSMKYLKMMRKKKRLFPGRIESWSKILTPTISIQFNSCKIWGKETWQSFLRNPTRQPKSCKTSNQWCHFHHRVHYNPALFPSTRSVIRKSSLTKKKSRK